MITSLEIYSMSFNPDKVPMADKRHISVKWGLLNALTAQYGSFSKNTNAKLITDFRVKERNSALNLTLLSVLKCLAQQWA